MEMAQLGAPVELIESLNQSRIIKILPENWPIVIWFNEVCDLMIWRHDGACLGLDLVQVKADADMTKRVFTEKQYQGLRVMSRTAARTINKVET